MQMGVHNNKKLLQSRQATAWATICSKKKKVCALSQCNKHTTCILPPTIRNVPIHFN